MNMTTCLGTGRLLCAAVALAAVSAFGRTAPTEIQINLRLDASDFVSGERIRGVVNVANSSPETLDVGHSDSRDGLIVEVYRASDAHQLVRVSKKNFVSSFRLPSGKGQMFETYLGDHYALREPSRYMAKPVLIHDGLRFEGQPRAFDIVEGVRAGAALQMFANRKGLQRNFELVYWSKGKGEHLYLKASDSGTQARNWETRDLGPILRIDPPAISILPSGEVLVLHRIDPDEFVRSEFWSFPDGLEFRGHSVVNDPETAGTARVRELYKEKGVAPKKNPWWKFW